MTAETSSRTPSPVVATVLNSRTHGGVFGGRHGPHLRGDGSLNTARGTADSEDDNHVIGIGGSLQPSTTMHGNIGRRRNDSTRVAFDEPVDVTPNGPPKPPAVYRSSTSVSVAFSVGVDVG